MSAWSDYQCGAISYEDYRFACRIEAMIDECENKPEKPADGCWNCMNFDWKHEACTVNWNNMDESYYNPDIDDRELTDCCEYHETDTDADYEEIFGGEQ